MTLRNQHGVMPRTEKAKAILKAYEKNVFGRTLDVCGVDREIAHNKRFTNKDYRYGNNGQTTNYSVPDRFDGND